jgi:GAF domain-containing protein
MYRDGDRDAALDEFRALLLTHRDGETMLQTACDALVAAGIGVDTAVIMVRHNNPPGSYITAASAPRSPDTADSRRVQFFAGPDGEAIVTQQVMRYSAAEVANRWPRFAEQDGTARLGGYVCVPLISQANTIGVLGVLRLYSTRGEIGADDAIINGYGAALTDAMSSRARFARADAAASAVNRMVRARAVIEQATGIMMQQHTVSAGAALEILCARSRRSQMPLDIIAENLIDRSDP